MLLSLPAEVLCLCEDEVVLLQDHLLQHGLDRGLPGITYHLADLQVPTPTGRSSLPSNTGWGNFLSLDGMQQGLTACAVASGRQMTY